MYRVRSPLPVLVGITCAAVIATVGWTVSAGGAQTATEAAQAGVTYGGLTPQGEPLWLRLRSDRKAILRLELDWYAPKARCTDGKIFASAAGAGSDLGSPVSVRNGRFTKTTVERYPRRDRSGPGTADAVVQRSRFEGSITPAAVTGRFTINVRGTRPDGSVYTCTLGPMRYKALN